MKPIETDVIVRTEHFVKKRLCNAEGGHDWWHIHRVRNMALTLCEAEGGNKMVVELAALLHDISDAKFNGGDDSLGSVIARDWLNQLGMAPLIVEHVADIVRHVSFKGGHNQSMDTREFNIVCDADRIDAIGAIGVARTFNYGGYKGLEMYNPDIVPRANYSLKQYREDPVPTINHFYEKLLLLAAQMKTKSGKKIARQRHQFMELYLAQFYDEWKGIK